MVLGQQTGGIRSANWGYRVSLLSLFLPMCVQSDAPLGTCRGYNGTECRNSLGDRGSPWCFTNDSTRVAEACAVPACTAADLAAPENTLPVDPTTGALLLGAPGAPPASPSLSGNGTPSIDGSTSAGRNGVSVSTLVAIIVTLVASFAALVAVSVTVWVCCYRRGPSSCLSLIHI